MRVRSSKVSNPHSFLRLPNKREATYRLNLTARPILCEGVKSTLDSCEAQGPFLGIQNLQKCDQILILGKHLERKRAAGTADPVRGFRMPAFYGPIFRLNTIFDFTGHHISFPVHLGKPQELSC